MFEKIFSDQEVISCHQKAPYKKERINYMLLKEKSGYRKGTLCNIARILLWAAMKFQTKINHSRNISSKLIEKSAHEWIRDQCCYRKKNRKQTHFDLFIREVTGWFKYLSLYFEVPKKLDCTSKIINSFELYMAQERGFASRTIETRVYWLRIFLTWNSLQNQSLSSIDIRTVDSFLVWRAENGDSKCTISNIVGALRAFFRFADLKNLCCKRLIHKAIEGPRIYKDERIQKGISWKDVKRLLLSVKENNPIGIRDKAILLLLTTYGFRSSEIAHLRLDDFNWQSNEIRIRRAKSGQVQIYPLSSSSGKAIIRYLRLVRPQSEYRELFLTLRPPFQPPSVVCISKIVSSRMTLLGINCQRKGPHAIRHSVATHLLSQGLTLRQMSDHIGHTSENSINVYAKVNLSQLRKVADFNFGNVL